MMPVFLIGYMGSGKSTIGYELSKIMGLPFLDLDLLIEEEIGMSIAEVFHVKGEGFFRKKERDILTKYNFNSSSIIATGGGTPCFFGNLYFMKSLGYTIYLKISCHELANRLKRDRKRPLLYNKKMNLKNFICQQLSEREHYYASSCSIIESDNILISQVQKIVNQII